MILAIHPNTVTCPAGESVVIVADELAAAVVRSTGSRVRSMLLGCLMLAGAWIPVAYGAPAEGAPGAMADRGSTLVEISAIEADGRLVIGHNSKTMHPSSLFGPQGILIVLAGDIHDDVDLDGRLDAAETIEYSYTVLNLGDSPLSALNVVDSLGAVACPQATLAVGSSMVCTRVYVITGSDAIAGAVVNQVDVTGTDGGGRNVQAADVSLTQNFTGGAGIRMFKSPQVIADVDGNGVVTEGDLLRYRFAVKNSGAELLSAVTVSEPDPTRIDTPIVCSATTVSGQAFAGNGTGALAAGETVVCTADYFVRSADAAQGSVLNVAEVRASAAVAGQIFGSAASTVLASSIPLIGVSKSVGAVTGTGPFQVRFDIRVRNFGTVALSAVQVTENLRNTFPLPVDFSVVGITVSGTAAPNPGFDGRTDVNLLASSQSTLAVGGEIVIQLRLEVTTFGRTGPYFNTVVASGTGANSIVVSDVSVSGTNPDPNDDGTPDEQGPTPISFPAPQAVAVPSASAWSLWLTALLMLGIAAASGVRARL
jgi:hypothetical protein